jgi:Docking domain of Afi1 for Arf3 in vesicle trafficking
MSNDGPTSYDGPYLPSQYPTGAAENHVEYILVASFDIDRGSVMEHQYPRPISGDENMLAELMLPDQAHVRSQDWTIFFLHKDTSAEEEAREERKRVRRLKRKRRDILNSGQPLNEDDESILDALEIADDGNDEDLLSSDDDDEGEGPPLIYVLNLVNTKQDQTVKRFVMPWITALLTLDRGAICKAMAICTRHSFLHIYKVRVLLC